MVAAASVSTPSAKSVSSMVSGRVPAGAEASIQSFSPETMTVEVSCVFVNS